MKQQARFFLYCFVRATSVKSARQKSKKNTMQTKPNMFLFAKSSLTEPLVGFKSTKNKNNFSVILRKNSNNLFMSCPQMTAIQSVTGLQHLRENNKKLKAKDWGTDVVSAFHCYQKISKGHTTCKQQKRKRFKKNYSFQMTMTLIPVMSQYAHVYNSWWQCIIAGFNSNIQTLKYTVST